MITDVRISISIALAGCLSAASLRAEPAEAKAALPSDPSPPRMKADPAREAITDPAQADGDFAVQGEYLGPALPGAEDCEHLGLQVIALGRGRFQAVLLRGGLPGAGWDRQTKTRLSGQWEDGIVSLAGSQYAARVAPCEALVRDARGSEAGRLRKIHRISATQDAPPPCGALRLFDGTHTDCFEKGGMDAEGLLRVGAVTKMPVGDFRMHLEFRTPYMPLARGQGRGNSGIYIQQRYEVQILDSFGLEGEDNECGGLYKQKRPEVNMCLPPLSWQTYDIFFTSARWDANGRKIANARITVLHNGEPVHQDYPLRDKTGSGKPENPQPRPILLQDHGNPVRFRNIWMELYPPAAREPAAWAACPAVPAQVMPAFRCWLLRRR